MRSPEWDRLPSRQKLVVMILTSVQLSLAVSAWVDLARRPAEQINGSKSKWAAVIAVNFVGPVLYFLRGRDRAGHGSPDRSTDAGASPSTSPDHP